MSQPPPQGGTFHPSTVEIVMPEYVQMPLPDTGIRLVVSAVWYGQQKACTVRATTDVPSDQFSHQIDGADVTGLFTLEELRTAMETLLGELLDRLG